MKKESIGSVVILAGIAIIGFIWFKRNKPTTDVKQLADLTAQSNTLSSGNVEIIDKPFEYSQQVINTAGSNPYTASTFTWGNEDLTPKQYQDIKNAIGTVNDPSAIYSGQVVLDNTNLNQLSNYDFSTVNWSNLDFSNIKI
jgi:hypothetical protein